MTPFARPPDASRLAALINGYSIEITPRDAARTVDFRAILPAATRIYIAHIDETPVEELLTTARRLIDQGFEVMPHFPARNIRDVAMLRDWVRRYQAMGVTGALLLAGNRKRPVGQFRDSMQLLQSGAFEGFKRLHVAGHPEGSRVIDPDGSDVNAMAALQWKQAFAERSGIEMAIVTQFCFDTESFIRWAKRIRKAKNTLPIHVGVAGPARLQTLLKYALLCGIGPSLQMPKERSADITRLLLPYEPGGFLTELAGRRAQNPDIGIAQIHFFPFGGVSATASWATRHGAHPDPLGAGTAHA